jgi:predicted CXXCH cytochrome family protein
MKLRALWILLLASPAVADTCAECHSDAASLFAEDIHRQRGFGCADCHGGDPSADDPERSMSRAKGFLGKIARDRVARLCARCHSDAGLMHRYNPRQRVDQYAQYITSNHGKRMAAGDTAAANCIDCHGVHGIREVKNPLSPVHPLKLPQTCARCHADAALMSRYRLDAGQFEEYRKSVHWEALARRGDLSAPSCASCHGNHGATPPEVTTVAAVCGTCHALLENLLAKSPHQPAFASIGGCVVCHGNHAVLRPSAAMLAGADAVCAQCHDAGSAGGKAAAAMAGLLAKLGDALGRSDEVLGRARRSGMEVSEALLRQQEARETLVKARVAVHAFRLEEVRKPVEEGLRIAAGTRSAGEEAMRERDRRRAGLAVSLLAIFITIGGLWLALRQIERPEAASVRR